MKTRKQDSTGTFITKSKGSRRGNTRETIRVTIRHRIVPTVGIPILQ